MSSFDIDSPDLASMQLIVPFAALHTAPFAACDQYNTR